MSKPISVTIQLDKIIENYKRNCKFTSLEKLWDFE